MLYNKILEIVHKKQLDKFKNNKDMKQFQVGDTVSVMTKIVEGNTTRIQKFQGVCIAKKNKGIASSFVVRKNSAGFHIERKFMIYSPLIEDVEVMKKGKVRRAKIYYIRKLVGKAARIKERKDK